MKIPRRSSSDTKADDSPVDLTKDAAGTPGSDEDAMTRRKSAPTPKRRDAQGRRGPVTAPKTRKEAYARQKELAKADRAKPTSTVKPRSAAEQRAALRRGDPSALPRRDQGPTRKLARDWVDSRRMMSNYLLWLFPLFVILSLIPALQGAQVAVLVIFLILVGEWYYSGNKLRTLAIERFGKAEGTAMSLGFYMGSRAYLPRRWRLPAPQVERGDDI